ncbi:hypothetical protein F4678DRAFT_461584 [Xylaria arbuscula]|nr:hypothetical protein F4678DRAFT_461584 [Xylaria arbuscula]
MPPIFIQRLGTLLAPQPSSCSDTQTALQASNLSVFPQGIDTVVLGLVHRLDKLTGPTEWTHPDATVCFAWTVWSFGSRRTTFIGFRPSFWGDISGEIVHFLAARCGVREILYFGKLGSVKRDMRPNKRLATGGRSLVRGQGVEWENVLAAATVNAEKDLVVLAGLPRSIDFVDPEVGMMAQAAVQSSVRFGYLHIVSDNVAEKYEEDLSNERMQGVLLRRAKLYTLVRDILGRHLSSSLKG